eukprot:Polyplicarium_translucidae@DN1726_c0_g1_i2.p4
MQTFQLCLCIAVAALWGVSTPFVKAGSAAEHRTLLNKRFVSACAVNQAGSVLFAIAVGSGELATTSAAANGLSFVFAFFAEMAWFGTAPTYGQAAGCALVCVGLALCVS